MTKEYYLIQINGHNDAIAGIIVATHIELHEIGEYPESSVLTGQMYDRVINDYDTMEEAMIDNPDVEIRYYTSGIIAPVPDLIPPANAGERWDDDY